MMMEETTTTTTRTVCPTASSATRELDDLMASLSDFKVKFYIKTLYLYGLTFVHKIMHNMCCLHDTFSSKTVSFIIVFILF